MNQVFISYRRGSGLYMAKNIATYIASHGYKVFFDYDSLENNEFDQQIYSAIENANDFILVLTENALDNCVNANDWVRAEVLHAKKHNKNIILATDAERFKSYPKNLPSELSFLKQIDWTPIHPKLFDGSMRILTKRLKSQNIKITVLYSLLIICSLLLGGLALYLFFPASMNTFYIDDDEKYPVKVLSMFDNKEDEDDFDDVFPFEVEVFFACSSSSEAMNVLIIQVEDFDDIDEKEYGMTEEEKDALIKVMENYSLRDYYLHIKKNLIASKYPLYEDFTPIFHKSGNFDWIIYRLYNSDNKKEMWRMSSKIADRLYLNIIMTKNKDNYLLEQKFIINLKRMLDSSDATFMNYIKEELY